MTSVVHDAATQRERFCAGLIELAHWLDSHPEVPLPSFGLHPDFRAGNYTPTVTAYLLEDQGDTDQRATLAGTARAMGRARKATNVAGDRLYIWRDFADGGIAYVVSAQREAVCERVVVGVEPVVETVPDPELVKAVPLVEVRTEREIVEWRCSPLLSEVDGAS